MVLPRVAAVAIAAVAGLHASSAAGYCRSRTCDPRVTDCDTDARGCIIEGELLFWDAEVVPIWVDQRGSDLRGIAAEDAARATAEAVDRWTTASCGGGMPALDVSIEGLLPGADAGFDGRRGATNHNVVTFVDSDWPHARSAVALTTMTFNTRTGEIVDADIEVNTASFDLAVTPSESQIDLGAVLTHEAGHVVGLAHSDVEGSTMQPESRGFGFRDLLSLEPDDVAGVCEIYPPDSEPSDPGNGEPQATAGNAGCSCRVGSGRRTESAAVLALLFPLTVLRRRRARAGRG